jgi:hypothetical protein
MGKCWRCGGGKTITMTTTGSHVLSCPSCGGSGESPPTREDDRTKVADWQRPEMSPLAPGKPLAADLSRTGSRVA